MDALELLLTSESQEQAMLSEAQTLIAECADAVVPHFDYTPSEKQDDDGISTKNELTADQSKFIKKIEGYKSKILKILDENQIDTEFVSKWLETGKQDLLGNKYFWDDKKSILGDYKRLENVVNYVKNKGLLPEAIELSKLDTRIPYYSRKINNDWGVIGNPERIDSLGVLIIQSYEFMALSKNKDQLKQNIILEVNRQCFEYESKCSFKRYDDLEDYLFSKNLIAKSRDSYVFNRLEVNDGIKDFFKAIKDGFEINSSSYGNDRHLTVIKNNKTIVITQSDIQLELESGRNTFDEFINNYKKQNSEEPTILDILDSIISFEYNYSNCDLIRNYLDSKYAVVQDDIATHAQ